jgi:hypothetical protein
MSFFCLFDESLQIEGPALDALVAVKGFQNVESRQLGRWTLLFSARQVVTAPLMIEAGDRALYAFGTVVYQSKGYLEGLKSLLEDFSADSVDLDALLGNFCVLYWDGQKIRMLVDRMHIQRVFTGGDGRLFSNSFLGALTALPGKCTIDRVALAEKALKGWIAKPDTLVKEIKVLSMGVPPPAARPGLEIIAQRPIDANKPEIGDRQDCVEHEVSVLREYFDSIRSLCEEYQPELGLSAGYDSRLVVSLARELPGPLLIQTHATRGHHDHEAPTAKRIAEHYGLKMRQVETVPPAEMTSEELSEMMDDSLYYFDAHNGYNMGAFGPVYTRKYRSALFNGQGLLLTGLGGEVLRNYFYSHRPRVNLAHWLDARVYYRPIEVVLPEEQFRRQVQDNFLAKIGSRLDVDPEVVNQKTLRRYYAEIHGLDNDSINPNAHNALSPYLAPFMEVKFTEEAYRALPHSMAGGTFQGAMIARIDPELAAMSSHYGYPLDGNEPLKTKLRAAIRGYMPERVWQRLWQKRLRRIGHFDKCLRKFEGFTTQFPQLAECYERLQDVLPEVNWSELRLDNASTANVFYIGWFLKRFDHKLTG